MNGVLHNSLGVLANRVIGRQSYADCVAALAPILWLRLGESSGTSAANAGSLSTTGTYVNSPTLGVTGLIAGDADTAVTFDAALSQRLTVPHDAALVPAAFTVLLWVKGLSGNTKILVQKYAAGTFRGYGLRVNGSGNAGFWVGDTSGGWLDSSYAINDGAAHLVAGTYAAGTATLYVDGQSRASGSRTAVLTDTVVFSLMTDAIGPAYTSGTADEVCLVGRALTADEHLTLYDKGLGN